MERSGKHRWLHWCIVLLVGETAYHRLAGRPYDKGRLIRTAFRQAVAAFGLLGVALVAVVFLLTDALFGGLAGASAATALGLFIALTWFGLPLWRRNRSTG